MDLVAAAELIKQNPKLLEWFTGAAKSSRGSVLSSVYPVTTHLSDEMVASMENTLRNLQACKKLEDQQPPEEAVEVYESTRRLRERRHLSPTEILQRSIAHKKRLEEFDTRPEGAAMMTSRRALPMNEYRDEVINQVANNPYSIIIGATGSGKTTQVPQILLEDAIKRGEGGSCDIICTQPRRIAATSVAQRVAAERLERLQSSVGYQVRFDARLPTRKLIFCWPSQTPCTLLLLLTMSISWWQHYILYDRCPLTAIAACAG